MRFGGEQRVKVIKVNTKRAVIIPKPILERVLHWDENTYLDYDIQFMDKQPVLCITEAKNELGAKKDE